jgi:hypothetical protein
VLSSGMLFIIKLHRSTREANVIPGLSLKDKETGTIPLALIGQTIDAGYRVCLDGRGFVAEFRQVLHQSGMNCLAFPAQ